jgi:hypothetical protein
MYAMKSWMELFSVSFKGHSIFRTFKLNQNIPAKNISLHYKESSLCNEWLGINAMVNVEILFFSFFSRGYNEFKFGGTKRLDRNTILDLLNISAIIKNLDVQNKK